ncbi:hypothetical protein CGZ75_19830 [Paenibacillus herberti]|uniref:VOC domain-containing protein n=1 Tax=Paenibacillus herberti TaxID=1619309 RepID=A0A229NTV1_9BACL|nr:hypothetical protein CGZ75_19830 [Paenibacillus herberti]
MIRGLFETHINVSNYEISASLNELGIESTNFLGESSGKLMVFPFMPAVSIYFDDPDGHSVEFISMLDDEPRSDLEIMPWRDWESLHGRQL